VRRKKQPQWTTSLVLLVVTLVACGRVPSDSMSLQDATPLPELGEPTLGITGLDLYERIDISADMYARRVEENMVVYFPSRKILFGGCMIIGMDSVGNTSDADLAMWPESVRDLSQFDFAMLVPGHGDRLDPGLLEHTLDLLADFQQ
jgi:hypothetical protein